MPHQFKDPELEQLALTHRSFGTPHNGRLEWLGDSILYAAISQILWERFPDLDQGVLNFMRAPLVRNIALAEAARRAGFPERIRLGKHEKANGLAHSVSVLAAAAEAYLAATHLDGGNAAEIAAELLAEPIAEQARILEQNGAQMLTDYRARLHMLLEEAGMPPPAYHYHMFTKRGCPRFRVACLADGQIFSRESKNAVRAEKAAAAKALARLEHSGVGRAK